LSVQPDLVVPHRTHWLAFPHLPGTFATRVDFLIDGKVRWIERNPPYTYSDDDGFLVTSFLSPGRHRFTVRVRTIDGRVVSDTVRARMLPAPTPPAQLAGKWQRDVAQAVPADPGASAGDSVPAGTWTLDFEQRWLEDLAPGHSTRCQQDQRLRLHPRQRLRPGADDLPHRGLCDHRTDG
jgi:hypothetical protein